MSNKVDVDNLVMTALSRVIIRGSSGLEWGKPSDGVLSTELNVVVYAASWIQMGMHCSDVEMSRPGIHLARARFLVVGHQPRVSSADFAHCADLKGIEGLHDMFCPQSSIPTPWESLKEVVLIRYKREGSNAVKSMRPTPTWDPFIWDDLGTILNYLETQGTEFAGMITEDEPLRVDCQTTLYAMRERLSRLYCDQRKLMKEKMPKHFPWFE